MKYEAWSYSSKGLGAKNIGSSNNVQTLKDYSRMKVKNYDIVHIQDIRSKKIHKFQSVRGQMKVIK